MAAVSTATASRALNRPNTVSDALRDRVDAAVAQLGYLPNQTARALSSLHSRLVGVLVPAIDLERAPVLEAIQARLNATGYTTLVAATGGDGDRMLGAARDMAAREVEGLLVVGAAPGRLLEALLEERRIPCVLVDAGGSAPPASSVDVRYAASGETVGAYLVGLGHRSLAFLGDPVKAGGHSAALLLGLRAALSASGGMLPPDRVLACGAREIRLALRQWFAAAAAPTALVCADDLLALAALRESAMLGIAVPGRLSVVGCGDLPFARHTSPALSTLRIPSAAIGSAAVDHLLARMAGGPPTSQDVSIKLVVRQSSGVAAP